jgi:hypothetical protein
VWGAFLCGYGLVATVNAKNTQKKQLGIYGVFNKDSSSLLA